MCQYFHTYSLCILEHLHYFVAIYTFCVDCGHIIFFWQIWCLHQISWWFQFKSICTSYMDMMIPKKDFWTISNKKYFVGDRQCSELLCRFCNVDYQNKVMRSAAIFLIWIVCHSSWHRAFDLYYPWQIVQSLQKWKLSPVRKSSFATVCFVFQKIFVRNQCLLIDIAINKLMGLPAITYLSKGGYEGGTFYIYHSNSPHC